MAYFFGFDGVQGSPCSGSRGERPGGGVQGRGSLPCRVPEGSALGTFTIFKRHHGVGSLKSYNVLIRFSLKIVSVRKDSTSPRHTQVWRSKIFGAAADPNLARCSSSGNLANTKEAHMSSK